MKSGVVLGVGGGKKSWLCGVCEGGVDWAEPAAEPVMYGEVPPDPASLPLAANFCCSLASWACFCCSKSSCCSADAIAVDKDARAAPAADGVVIGSPNCRLLERPNEEPPERCVAPANNSIYT